MLKIRGHACFLANNPFVNLTVLQATLSEKGLIGSTTGDELRATGLEERCGFMI
jgi:hypothetical protein